MPQCSDPASHLVTIHLGHADVQKNRFRHFSFDRLKRAHAVVNDGNLITEHAQKLSEAIARVPALPGRGCADLPSPPGLLTECIGSPEGLC